MIINFTSREEVVAADYEKVEAGFRLILEGLGINPTDSPHFERTPERAARAWINELCQGLTKELPAITTFPAQVDEMIMLRNIPIRSLCAHHLLPFFGTATIAYIPGKGRIFGLSKLSRIANYYARKPNVQEELTDQIADALAVHVVDQDVTHGKVHTSGGVGVLIKANHMCMELRGVNHSGETVTSALRGLFASSPSVRAEFLALTHNGG